MEKYVPRNEIENDSTWIPSLGADLIKLHWRNGKFHATCNPDDDICMIHEDKHDPHQFPVGTAQHLWDWNKVGSIGIGLLSLYALDKTFNSGKLIKKVRKELGL